MKQPEDIDRLVRQRLLETEPSGDWDVPSDSVWTAVEQRIRSKRRRRGAFWWIFAGVLLFVFSSILYTHQRSDSSLEDANPIEGQSTVNADVTSSTNAEVNDMKEPETSMSKHDVPGADESESRPTHSLTAKIQEGDSDVVQMATNSQDFISQTTSPISAELVEKESNFSAVNESESTEVARVSSSLPENPENSLLPVRLNVEQLAFLQSDITNLTPPFFSLPSIDISQVLSITKSHTWSLAFTLSPSFGTRKITVPDNRPRVRRDLLLQQEDPALQLGFGMTALYQISPAWSIGLGAEYSPFLLKSSSMHQIRYSQAGERLNDRGNFENNYRLNLSTSYGELSTDVVIERSSDVAIEEHRFINLKLETEQSMKVLRIPVSLRYQFAIGNTRAYCYGGLSANLLLQNSLEFKAVRSLDSEILDTRSVRKVQMKNYEKFGAGYTFGLGIELPMTQQASLTIGPSIGGYLQSVHSNKYVSIYPFVAQLDLGVRYHFR